MSATKESASAGMAWLSLLTSSSTLICCALPSMLVALGAGAALSGLIGAVPQLVTISEHKNEVFSCAFLLLAANGFWLWRNRNAPCPIGLSAAQAANCTKTRAFSRKVYWCSLGLFCVGAWFAFGY